MVWVRERDCFRERVRKSEQKKTVEERRDRETSE